MNPFKTPKSNLEITKDINQHVDWLKTFLFTILSIVAAFVASIHITGIIANLILMLINDLSLEALMLLDAALSLFVLLLVFYTLSSIKNVHSIVVVMSGAIFMFIYWGFESDAFFNGLNPMFPAWFEINMAINDIVAGVFALFLKNRMTSRSKRTALKQATF